MDTQKTQHVSRHCVLYKTIHSQNSVSIQHMDVKRGDCTALLLLTELILMYMIIFYRMDGATVFIHLHSWQSFIILLITQYRQKPQKTNFHIWIKVCHKQQSGDQMKSETCCYHTPYCPLEDLFIIHVQCPPSV